MNGIFSLFLYITSLVWIFLSLMHGGDRQDLNLALSFMILAYLNGMEK